MDKSLKNQNLIADLFVNFSFMYCTRIYEKKIFRPCVALYRLTNKFFDRKGSNANTQFKVKNSMLQHRVHNFFGFEEEMNFGKMFRGKK